jgi:hypothetical protein
MIAACSPGWATPFVRGFPEVDPIGEYLIATVKADPKGGPLTAVSVPVPLAVPGISACGTGTLPGSSAQVAPRDDES